MGLRRRHSSHGCASMAAISQRLVDAPAGWLATSALAMRFPVRRSVPLVCWRVHWPSSADALLASAATPLARDARAVIGNCRIPRSLRDIPLPGRPASGLSTRGAVHALWNASVGRSTPWSWTPGREERRPDLARRPRARPDRDLGPRHSRLGLAESDPTPLDPGRSRVDRGGLCRHVWRPDLARRSAKSSTICAAITCSRISGWSYHRPSSRARAVFRRLDGRSTVRLLAANAMALADLDASPT